MKAATSGEAPLARADGHQRAMNMEERGGRERDEGWSGGDVRASEENLEKNSETESRYIRGISILALFS